MFSYWRSALRGRYSVNDEIQIRSLFLLHHITEQHQQQQDDDDDDFVIPLDIIATSVLCLYPSCDSFVQCVLRYRPGSKKEIQHEGELTPSDISDITYPPISPRIPVLPHDTTNEYIFESYGKPLVDTFVLDHLDACLWTYGANETGKTYTVLGVDDSVVDPGIVPRMLQYMEHFYSDDLNIEMCVYQVYSERVKDLLKSGDEYTPGLRIRSNPSPDRPYIEGLSWHTLTSENQWGRDLIQQAKRTKGIVSRSSMVYEFKMTMRMSGVVLPHRLSVVDSMTSQRPDRHPTFDLTVRVSKSLSTLGNVIHNLVRYVANEDHVFIPYRESVVTHLLKHTFGCEGCRTVVVGTVSPSPICANETISTIRFLDRWSKLPIFD
eukprot:PhF_6_TR30725/c0_g1_i1/m.45214/K17916/KIF16B, SNX23; kinesin family member 16B